MDELIFADGCEPDFAIYDEIAYWDDVFLSHYDESDDPPPEKKKPADDDDELSQIPF